jgi:PBP1b-binding outer membrane lipoprotein LpoB
LTKLFVVLQGSIDTAGVRWNVDDIILNVAVQRVVNNWLTIADIYIAVE